MFQILIVEDDKELSQLFQKVLAPQTAAPIHSGIAIPVFSLIPMAIGANATMVPTDVPMEVEMKQPTHLSSCAGVSRSRYFLHIPPAPTGRESLRRRKDRKSVV